MGKIDLLVHILVCQYNKSCFKTFKIFWFANLFNDAGLATIAMWEWGLRKCLLKINRLYQFIRNIQPYSFIGNIHPCSFLEKFTPTRLLDTYSPLLVYYKVWGLKKLTTFVFGLFTTISGHFLAKYMIIFHKT